MTETDRIARRIVVRGRVQGVFYRHSCRREARSRGVAGWVMNRPDGTVEALFEGTKVDVETLVRWARVGPEQAIVERSEVEHIDPTGLTDFEVLG